MTFPLRRPTRSKKGATRAEKKWVWGCGLGGSAVKSAMSAPAEERDEREEEREEERGRKDAEKNEKEIDEKDAVQ